MAKVLISLAEVIAALERVPKIDVAGEPHVEQQDLGRALGELIGPARHPSAMALAQAGFPVEGLLSVPSLFQDPRAVTAPEVEMDPVTHVPVDPAFIAERERLAALPPGPCVGCSQIHPDGPAVREDGTVLCDDYIDRTVRSPAQERLQSGATQPILAGVEMIPEAPGIRDFIDARLAHDTAAGSPLLAE